MCRAGMPCSPVQCWTPLRAPLAAGKTMADIPKDTLEDACQLVKANSIQVTSLCFCGCMSLQAAGCWPHLRSPSCPPAGQQDEQHFDCLHSGKQPAQERRHGGRPGAPEHAGPLSPSLSVLLV